MRNGLLLYAAVAASLAAAAPYKCPKTGLPPALNGDPFFPIECSTAPAAALPLPDEPAGPPAAPALKELKGEWEGVLIKGAGRYAVTLEVKPGWLGKAELVLRWKEQQLRTTGWSSLALAPGKEKGVYGAALKASALPDASLPGQARFSEETGLDGSPRSRADLSFANGAAHRLRWSLPSKDALRFSATWAVPQAPLQALEGELRRRRP